MKARSPKNVVVESKGRRRKLLKERRLAFLARVADALRSRNIEPATL
jgi:hypothetical protein